MARSPSPPPPPPQCQQQRPAPRIGGYRPIGMRGPPRSSPRAETVVVRMWSAPLSLCLCNGRSPACARVAERQQGPGVDIRLYIVEIEPGVEPCVLTHNPGKVMPCDCLVLRGVCANKLGRPEHSCRAKSKLSSSRPPQPCEKVHRKTKSHVHRSCPCRGRRCSENLKDIAPSPWTAPYPPSSTRGQRNWPRDSSIVDRRSAPPCRAERGAWTWAKAAQKKF